MSIATLDRSPASRRALPLAVPLALALAGLAGGCTSGDDAGTCRPDPALIAQKRACRADDQCPCGTSCVLGVCEARCTSDDACGGGRCDRFGRCRASGDDGVIPPLVKVAQPEVTVLSPSVEMVPKGTPEPVRIRVRRAAPGGLRIAPEAGLEVRCKKGGPFGVECRYASVKAGQVILVWVRPTAAGASAGPRVLRVYYGARMETVSVKPAAAKGPPKKARPDAGQYRGTVTLLAAGVSKSTLATGGQTFDDIAVPVTAALHWRSATTGVLALTDPAGLLAPKGTWNGRVTVQGAGKGTVDLPTLAFISGEATKGAGVEVLLDALPAAYRAHGDVVTFDLVTRFQGVVMGARTPQARWRVTLRRTGDLAAGATVPQVPPDATARLAVSRGLSPLPGWEAALAHAATPDQTRILGLTAAAKRALLDVYGRRGKAPTLEACNLSASTASSLAQLALTDGWGVAPAAGAAWTSPATVIAGGRPIATRLAQALKTRGATSIQVKDADVVSPRPRELPCRAAFVRTTASFTGTCGGAASVPLAFGTVDVCKQLRAAYGCEVVDVSSGAMTISATVAYKDARGCARTNAALSVTGKVSRVCRLPVVPAPCGELALCYAPPAGGGTTRASVASSYLDPSRVLPVSGDLRCVSGGRTAAIALDVNAERKPGDSARLTAAGALTACAADLDAVRKASPPRVPDYADGLQKLLPTARCIQAARFIYALGLATDADRRRALGGAAPVLPAATALANRLVQRWLFHHAFVAKERMEAERMAQALRGDSTVPATDVPKVEAVLPRSLAGWDLLFHPRFASALVGAAPSALLDPDYRQRISTTPVARKASHRQGDAFPVAMLEALSAQLSLVEPRLERAGLERDRTALKILGGLMRRVYVARAIASQVVADVEAHVAAKGLPKPAWLGRYRAAAGRTRGLLRRVVTQASAIVRGDNPLGIRDDDVPLYFLGDQKSAGRRFSAISDYLLGTGPSSNAWAPTLVRRATASFAAARAAWLKNRKRAIQEKRSAASLASRLDKIRTTYGRRIATLCGTPKGMLTRDILEKWPRFSAATCHVRSDDPRCKVDLDAYAKLLTADQVGYQLCVVAALRRTNKNVRFFDAALNAMVDAYQYCPDVTFPARCKDGTQRCAICKAGARTVTAAVTPDAFRIVLGLDTVTAADQAAARAECRPVYPNVDTRLPTVEQLPGLPRRLDDCFRGTIGAAVGEIRAAAKVVEIARSRLGDLKESYVLAMNNCINARVAGAEASKVSRKFKSTLAALAAAKLTSDLVAVAAGSVKDCAGRVASQSASNPFGIAAGIACASAFVQGAAKGVSLGLSAEMNRVKKAHDAAVGKIRGRVAARRCLNDADQKLVGMNTEALRIQKAMLNLDAAQARLLRRQVEAKRAYDDGIAALAATRGREVASLVHDGWLDEKVDQFLRDMRLARRVMYLAVRAVEYETQQSLALTAKILAARRPVELQKALDQLVTSAATRAVAGKRPAQLKVVLSLRQHLLQLADRRGAPAGEQNLSDVERFRLLLRSPRYALYDDKGTYLGQRIPFSIAPLGKLGLGQAQGIPLLTGSDCAERLWSVNASVLGGDQLYRGAAKPSFIRIDLLKQNTFYSQWCRKPAGAKDPFQVASVRPSQNLFQDPVYGGQVGNRTNVSDETKRETRARIQAFLGVDRKALEADSYENGQTSELAARGLYGEYALFFPAAVLSTAGGPGLALNRVDDVLLRLDYVSVAR